jgi:hypothetical protein
MLEESKDDMSWGKDDMSWGKDENGTFIQMIDSMVILFLVSFDFIRTFCIFVCFFKYSRRPTIPYFGFV